MNVIGSLQLETNLLEKLLRDRIGNSDGDVRRVARLSHSIAQITS